MVLIVFQVGCGWLLLLLEGTWRNFDTGTPYFISMIDLALRFFVISLPWTHGLRFDCMGFGFGTSNRTPIFLGKLHGLLLQFFSGWKHPGCRIANWGEFWLNFSETAEISSGTFWSSRFFLDTKVTFLNTDTELVNQDSHFRSKNCRLWCRHWNLGWGWSRTTWILNLDFQWQIQLLAD